MADVFVPSVNDAAVFTTDKFGLLKDGDGKTYQTVVKANVNGNYDVYSKGTGTFGADELLYQYNASSNQADFRDGKFKDKETAAYNSFFKSGNAEGFNKNVKRIWYGEAPPNSAKRMATLDAYKSIAATVPIRQAQTNVPGGSLTIQTASGPVTTSVPTATDPAVADAQKPTDADINTAKTDIVSTNPNTRDGPNTYGNLRYPLKLKDNQDYINIIMLKYVPKPIGQNTTAGTPSPRGNKDRLTLGSVTLPIPAGISDSNRVNWGDDSLQPLESALADIMTSGITGQNGGVGGATERALNTVAKNSTDAQKLFTSKFVQNTLGVNILKRNEGAIINPNMELLFNSPSLRSFPFNFRLTPRSEDEAKMVRKIIRFFKQGMSVQRSKSELFLKAPNTFQITYYNGQSKEHPYLTKFKECALTDFSVNYTPDGSYMTYEGNEASMTAYEISMQFQELEPIFNDDYTKIDGNNDTYIGY
jgi:hypothetical protein